MLNEATLYGTPVVVLYLRACLNEDFEKMPNGCGVENLFFPLLETMDGASELKHL